MKVNKTTTGFVIQTFDTDTGRCVSQQFIAGDQVDYEDENGDPVEWEEAPKAYQPFEMVQPRPIASSVGAGEGRQTGTRIEVPCYGIVLELGPKDPDRPGVYQGGKIVSGLEREKGAVEFDAALDAVEALILAHAVAGMDVASPAYVEGIETAVEACGNHVESLQEEGLWQETARLVQQAPKWGIRSGQIDDLVHETAAAEASSVNNGGLTEQIEYLVRHLGVEETEQELAQFSESSGQEGEMR